MPAWECVGRKRVMEYLNQSHVLGCKEFHSRLPLKVAAEIRDFMGIGLFLGHGCLAPSCEFSGVICIIPVFNLFPIHHFRHVAKWIHLTCVLFIICHLSALYSETFRL